MAGAHHYDLVASSHVLLSLADALNWHFTVKILVIGGGGREHAIAWRLSVEGHRVFGAPGNPGIAQVAQLMDASDYVAAAESVGAELTVVGPETPLAEGIVDRFRARGLRIFGPTREQAQLESSKIYAKEFMRRTGIPTGRFARAHSPSDALDSLRRFSYPMVIKADGLAGGKGVIIAHDSSEAGTAIQTLGPHLVIEEFLDGEEVSFIVVSDGHNVVALEATQDHKTVFDGDTGPNTGGMGAYCDGRILSTADAERVMDTIVEPAIQATRFTGFLYAGLMLTADGPKVIEFNVRLGDPETQPLMHRLEGGFADTLVHAANGNLRGASLTWRSDPSVCVVLTAAGYPGKPRTGDLITGIETCGAQVFHAGTQRTSRGLETAGGRILGVTASGDGLPAAIRNTYAAVEQIHFQGMHYRRDIAAKGLKRW
jgi:phosphoribosylamine--glycine ligase